MAKDRRKTALATRALGIQVSSLSTSDLGKETYRLLIRALRSEVRRLKGQGGLDLETLGTAGRVLELLTSGHATLDIKPTTPGMVVRTLSESYPADLPRLIAAARGEVPGVAGYLGAQGPRVGSRDSGGWGTQGIPPRGHSCGESAGTGTPPYGDVSPQPEAEAAGLDPLEPLSSGHEP